MTAIKRAPDPNAPRPSGGRSDRSREELLQVVELLFFAYRDFTGEPDKILIDYGLGRAHHRVLHFVNREPGVRVADLLQTLMITKQSLARVLKQLVDDGWIEARSGAEDRRERLLFTTAKGQALAARLAEGQMARIRAALTSAGPGSDQAVRRFLVGMLAEDQQARVVDRLKAQPARARREERS